MQVIPNPLRLKRLLHLDAFLGGITALIGLVFTASVAKLLGLSSSFLVRVAGITLLYTLLAGFLAMQSPPSVWLINVLVRANWLWTLISVGLLLWHFPRATALGIGFLVLQVVVVGMLAYLEGREIKRLVR